MREQTSSQSTFEGYRGRLAPSPTGLLHLGHARTFYIAQTRAGGGTLILRNEDLDAARCKPEFVAAMLDDLRWLGFTWQEGCDMGGPRGPYNQSQRQSFYRSAFDRLVEGGFLFPCGCSRKDVRSAAQAPHPGDDEPVYPGTCRLRKAPMEWSHELNAPPRSKRDSRINWRFRVPDGETVRFVDEFSGPHSFVAGRDFGDFVVWRSDDAPSYQLAVVVDDSAMRITEVVRGDDLLVSTARQILLYRALGIEPPAFYHCPVVTDGSGVRLSKRHDALSLRKLRENGHSPESLRRFFQSERSLLAGDEVTRL